MAWGVRPDGQSRLLDVSIPDQPGTETQCPGAMGGHPVLWASACGLSAGRRWFFKLWAYAARMRTWAYRRVHSQYARSNQKARMGTGPCG